MKKLVFVCLLTLIGNLEASVLMFDDITSDVNDFGPIPDGYGGFDWTLDGVIHKDYFVSSGYGNGVVSGDYVTQAGDVGSNITGSEFTFNGAYFTAAWNNGLEMNIEGYNNGNLLYSDDFTIDTYSPTWISFDWVGIDELKFATSGGINAGLGYSGPNWAMDDFTYNNPIPEPATLSLLALGGLVLRRRRTPYIAYFLSTQGVSERIIDKTLPS